MKTKLSFTHRDTTEKKINNKSKTVITKKYVQRLTCGEVHAALQDEKHVKQNQQRKCWFYSKQRQDLPYLR